MAKVNIEFDTSSKELTVTMDGKSIPNVQGVNLSKGGYYSDSSENEYAFSLVTLDKADDDSYKTYTQIIARNTNEGAVALREGAGSHEHPEFVKKSGLSPKVMSDIANFLRRKRK